MHEFDVSSETGQLTSSEGLPIRYELYEPMGHGALYGDIPVIIFVHGFKGFKNWGAFPDACAWLAGQGFGVLAIDLSRNGVGADAESFDELDLFADATLSQDLDDVITAVHAISSGELSGRHNDFRTEEMGVIGHSRGGHTAIVAALESEFIHSVVTWAAVSDYREHWSEEMVSDWKENGQTTIMNGRTGQEMPLNKKVYDDLLEKEDQLVAIEAIKKLNKPVCLIHGEEDESVPYQAMDDLFEACPSKNKERHLIPNTGHTFDTQHPWDSESFPKPFAKVLDFTYTWMAEHLELEF
ncbi:MAG: alpha/beta hydrolase family protein [Bacteroidota bacterium]